MPGRGLPTTTSTTPSTSRSGTAMYLRATASLRRPASCGSGACRLRSPTSIPNWSARTAVSWRSSRMPIRTSSSPRRKPDEACSARARSSCSGSTSSCPSRRVPSRGPCEVSGSSSPAGVAGWAPLVGSWPRRADLERRDPLPSGADGFGDAETEPLPLRPEGSTAGAADVPPRTESAGTGPGSSIPNIAGPGTGPFVGPGRGRIGLRASRSTGLVASSEQPGHQSRPSVARPQAVTASLSRGDQSRPHARSQTRARASSRSAVQPSCPSQPWYAQRGSTFGRA